MDLCLNKALSGGRHKMPPGITLPVVGIENCSSLVSARGTLQQLPPADN